MNENQIATVIVDCAFKVHNALGPGLLETVYEAAMMYELKQRGLRVISQQGIPANYCEVNLDVGFRADIIVENKVIIEIKSVETLAPVHSKILLTYLRLTEIKLGLLINFEVDLIKNWIKRVVNGL